MLGIPKYVGVSALAALGVIYHAFSTREQYDIPYLCYTQKEMSSSQHGTINASFR